MMNHKFFKNRICALVLLLAVLCGTALTASAADLPDLTQKGSIAVTLKPGCSLTLHRAGQPLLQDGNYSWQLTPDFAGSQLKLADLTAPRLPGDQLAWAQRKKLAGVTQQADAEGRILFKDLEAGLYLLSQQTAAEGYYPVSPFLVTLPQRTDDGWAWQADAKPKTQMKEKPGTVPPPKPEEPKLPQTGQLNWPVPLLAAVGMLLFGSGWCLYYSGKGREER